MMRGGRIVNDGLWRCLCPAFNRMTLARPLHTSSPTRIDNAKPKSPSSSANESPNARLPTIFKSEGLAANGKGAVETKRKGARRQEAKRSEALHEKQNRNPPDPYTRKISQPATIRIQGDVWDSSHRRLRRKDHFRANRRAMVRSWRESHRTRPKRGPQMTVQGVLRLKSMQHPPKNASPRVIKLAIMRLRRGYTMPNMDDRERYERIVFLSRHLVDRKQYAVDTFIYESLMVGMAIPEAGSSEGIGRLIQDMENQRIQPTLLFCELGLTACINHPSYIVRHKILTIMKERWMEVGAEAQQSIILSMLREGQYENAFDKLMEMGQQGHHIDTWVFDIFIMVFAEHRFTDEMLMLLNLRKEKILRIPIDAVHIALDTFSSENHYEGTIQAWKYLSGQSPPGDKVLHNILNVAARHGDSALASEMFGLLSQRVKLQDYHYETVADAFLVAGNIDGALRTYAVAHGNVEVDLAMIAAFETMLMNNAQMVDPAEQALQSLLQEFEMPATVVECIMRVKAEHEGVEAAADLAVNQENWAGVAASPSLILDLIGKRPTLATLQSLCSYYQVRAPLSEDDPERRLDNVHQLILDFTMAEQLDVAFRWANRYLDRHGGEVKWIAPLVGAATQVQDGRLWEIEERISTGDNEDLKTAMRFALRQQRVGRQ